MLETVKRQLQAALRGKELQLRINDNRSNMLSVRWDGTVARVSLHRLFLDAPPTVMDQLACYIGGEATQLPYLVRRYMDEAIEQLDYSDRVDIKRLKTQGTYYDLLLLYEEVSHSQFGHRLPLHISWFGQKGRARPSAHRTLGLFYAPTKLIKVHSCLDTPLVPEYVLSYVIYHEMLHYISPPYYDVKGNHQIHSQEFVRREQLFPYYESARDWISTHQQLLFD